MKEHPNVEPAENSNNPHRTPQEMKNPNRQMQPKVRSRRISEHLQGTFVTRSKNPRFTWVGWIIVGMQQLLPIEKDSMNIGHSAAY
jgi:hypothetical protein